MKHSEPHGVVKWSKDTGTYLASLMCNATRGVCTIRWARRWFNLRQYSTLQLSNGWQLC